MKSARGFFIALAALAAILVVVGTLGTQAEPPHGHDHDHSHGPPALDMENPLLVTTRTELRICVQLEAADLSRTTAGRQLLTALDTIRDGQRWRQAYGKVSYHAESVLTWGCPDPASLRRYNRRDRTAGPDRTDNPSPFRVWVAILDDATANRLIGADVPARVADAEFMRAGRDERILSFAPASTVVLIRAHRLADRTATTRYLNQALGLAIRE